MRTLGRRWTEIKNCADIRRCVGIRRRRGGSPRGARARCRRRARTSRCRRRRGSGGAWSSTGAARQQKSGSNSSRSHATPVRRTRRSSSRSACGSVIVSRREAFEAGAQRSARRASRGREREHDLAERQRVGVVAISGFMPGQLRHALQAALEDHPQLVVAQHRQVGALVRAREQVVDDAGEVVAVGLLGDGVAEAAGEAGRGRRGGARRRPRRTGWPAGCTRWRRSCRASRATSSARTPSGARASSHVTLSAARAVLSPRCDLVACILAVLLPPDYWIELDPVHHAGVTSALHDAARPRGRRTGSGAGRGTRAA